MAVSPGFAPHPWALFTSRALLNSLGVRITLHHSDRLPAHPAAIVVSNHRSFLDAPLMMVGMDRPVRIACHPYMTQVPLLREAVHFLGCIPIDGPKQQPKTFVPTATQTLQENYPVGLFPEGGGPMVSVTAPDHLGKFHRGFVHLALHANMPEPLPIVPMAIASTQETWSFVAPFKLFRWFAPSEPLFHRPGWHPTVVYHRVHLVIGHPIWITADHRQRYHGKQAGVLTKKLTQDCEEAIAQLLAEGLGYG
ncbi:MAG: 1-acyl-sn-glycerol-3-phosphate acyltransferase [Merismopedia sp. SIO2A8]|nr:1-acyl-sn-glycerol-3-phosphate acyltransferase [Merismopedia sp. SIO2A8]